mgnify:CR=1 FL=1
MLAATRLIALHKNKGMTVEACLKNRTDYIENPDKTEQGQFVSSYACSALTADEEFMLTKRQYDLVNGRRQKSDVIAYQIRQSFRPGEITAEEANKVGYELAMRFTKGKHAFVVATHTDRQHIHNHVIFNSTALDGTKKFRDFFFSALAVQRLSDLICLEHQLSVIEKKSYRERQKRVLYPPKESNRDRLCGIIDTILAEKPGDYETFLQKLEQQGYEVKRGKYTSVKGARQKRFIRFRTLGAGYSEEELKVVISGEVEHHPRQKQNRIVPEQKFQMLVDIQAKLAKGKGTGYERWAKKYNLKAMAQTLILLQEKDLLNEDALNQRIAKLETKYHDALAVVKDLEGRMKFNKELRYHVAAYTSTKNVAQQLKTAKRPAAFEEQHRAELTAYRAAAAYFKANNITKLPSPKKLEAEYAQLASEKAKFYEQYKEAKEELLKLKTAKQNVASFFREEEPAQQER